ncbi:citrate synthase [Marmoricola endophyticus]|uniref:citrate synthase n=1 Tax=Marmoricola endophyticus TaxID=2040280 RepID=UPI00166A5D0D|nr:citrate synthase [Marmoricola endophyticus]
MTETGWIAAPEAAQRLGVKRTTLYTYVSRGLLTPRRRGGESRFSRADVDALAAGRRHPGAPAGVLRMRSVRSAVSEVREGELFLRGTALADLADEAYDDVVDLVLGPGDADSVEVPAHLADVPRHRRLPALAQWAAATRPDVPVDAAARGLVTAAPTVMGGSPGPTASALFVAVAGRPGRPSEVAALNTALVALVDHGLAASVVAARVAASARSSSYDCVVAGYAALAGRLHGAIAPAALEVLRDHLEPHRLDAPDHRRSSLSRPADAPGQAPVPGFGHWRHPAGDPRADTLLARVALVEGAGPVLDALEDLADRLERRPNIDAALAALTLACDLPDETGEVCFQVGRTTGIAAHVVEELGEVPLRWRARDPEG